MSEPTAYIGHSKVRTCPRCHCVVLAEHFAHHWAWHDPFKADPTPPDAAEDAPGENTHAQD